MTTRRTKKGEAEATIVAAAKELLRKNRKTVSGYTFTIPSPYEYRHQWLWDSCFHAIVLRHFDTRAAEGELRSLVAAQRSNGMIPHEGKYNLFGHLLPFTSRITQPPFIARAVLDVYSKSLNMAFLAGVFSRLQQYNSWLEDKREINNVLKVVNPNESGEDNSVLWDKELPLPLHRAYGWLSAYLPLLPQLLVVKSVTATSIYADSLESMARIARILGKKELSASYSKKHAVVVAAVTKMFKKEDGFYLSKTMTDKWLKYKTHSVFSPMFCGAVSKAEAKKLVDEHLLNEKEFWTPYAIPTVAVNERKFSAKGYWRGPMWMNINWMLHRGLTRYGLKAVAAELLEKTIAAVRKSGFREYYNPITGEGLGAKQFGWSTLVADMILEK